MPQFVVPQFIDVEDKIIGPITTRQFIMGVVAMLLIFLAYRFADTLLFIIEAVVIFLLYILIGFLKINGLTSYLFALHILQTLTKPTLRVWVKKRERNIRPMRESADDASGQEARPNAPRKVISQQRLSSLTLLMDTGGRYRPEDVLRREPPAAAPLPPQSNT